MSLTPTDSRSMSALELLRTLTEIDLELEAVGRRIEDLRRLAGWRLTVALTRANEGSRLTRSDGQWWPIIGRLGANRHRTATSASGSSSSSADQSQSPSEMRTTNSGHWDTIHYGAHEDHTHSATSSDDPECLILSSPELAATECDQPHRRSDHLPTRTKGRRRHRKSPRAKHLQLARTPSSS